MKFRWFLRCLMMPALLPSFAQTSPDRLRQLIEQAQAADQQDRTEESMSLYREILRLRPHWPSAELNLGLIYHSRKEYDKAIALLSEVLRHDAGLHSALLFRGASYYHTGQYDKAERDLERYLTHAPNDAEALSYLGSLYFERNDYARAAAAYAALVKAAPSETFLFHLSDCYLQSARMAMKRLSEDPRAKYFFLLMSAEDLLPESQRDVANRHIQDAIQMDPGAPEAHAVLRRLTQKADAAESCDIPADPALSRALLSARTGDISQATKELVGIEDRGRMDPRTVYWSFQIYKLLTQATARMLTERAPESPWLWLLRAQISEQNGRHAEAEREYQRALALPGTEFESHVRFAKFLCKLQRFDAAIDSYERALSFNPENARVEALIGEVHLTQGRPEKALPHLEKALGSHPQEAQTRIYLAQSLIHMHRTREAVAVLEAAPEDTDGRIHYLLGKTFQQLGQSAKARQAMNIFRQRRTTPAR